MNFFQEDKKIIYESCFQKDEAGFDSTIVKRLHQ